MSTKTLELTPSEVISVARAVRDRIAALRVEYASHTSPAPMVLIDEYKDLLHILETLYNNSVE